MQNELFEVNTPETLGVTPRYVLQHNAISRSAHAFSATAKKLTAMAMSLLPADLSSLSSAFTFADFCNALNYTKSGKSFSLFKDAVKECMESVIEVETPPDRKGKTSWVMFHWFKKAEFNKDSGVCTMTFDQDLAEFLKELKRLYAKINLSDLGRLQSRYALRIFEVVISYASLQGKDGNEAQSWYIERSIPEIRKLFGVDPKEYQENYEFRRKVLESPIREINQSGIGVEIKTESIKKGRYIAGFRFDCKKVLRTVKKKRRKQAADKPAELSDLKGGRTRQSLEAKELEHLKERYPAEFAELYEQALETLPSFGKNIGEGLRKTAAEVQALEALRKRHGIVK